MSGECYVYILYRDDGLTPFYVGKGKGDRWLQHERWARPGRSHKDNIIHGMKMRGIVVPKVKVAEGMTDTEALALEVELIAAVGRRPLGPLTNLTAGGDGVVDMSPEAKARHSANTGAAQRGKKHSAERCARASERQKAIPRGPHSETAKQRTAASMVEHWADPANRERRKTSGMAGRSHSPETKEKMRIAAAGRRNSAEARAKMSASHTGKVVPSEVRARMSDAQRARWAMRKAVALVQ